MSKVKFILSLTIEGDSLEDIDNGLCKAAGERLMARMENPPKLNGKTIVRGPDIKKIEQKEPHKEKKEAPHPNELSQESPPVRALRAVHAKHGASVVAECLANFGVERVSQLSEEQKEEFVGFCNSKLDEAPHEIDQ